MIVIWGGSKDVGRNESKQGINRIQKRRKENEVLDQTPKLDIFFDTKVAETGEGSAETMTDN